MDGAIAAGLGDSRRGSRGSCAINEALLVVYSALPQVHGEVMGILGGWGFEMPALPRLAVGEVSCMW